MKYIPPKKLSEQRFRHELKYVLPVEKANRLMEELKLFCRYDRHVGETRSYEISSIYYDTADLRFYFDRVESVGYRRKVRLRSYNKHGKALALFIEIKERHKQAISKKRINLRDMDVLKCGITHNVLPLSLVVNKLEDSAEAREIDYLNRRLGLEPTVIVRYLRQALIPVNEDKMRITLDTRLTTGGTSLNEYSDKEEKFIINPAYGIFEVKTDRYIPAWLQSVLKHYNLSQTRFSKYCLSVDAVYGVPGRTWFPSRCSRTKQGGMPGVKAAMG